MAYLLNPYENVDWETCHQVCSLSHGHSRKRANGVPGTVYQYYLTNAVNAGYQHIAFSNYYPSEPFDPLTDWFETVPDDIISSPNAEHFYFGMKDAYHINGLGSTLVTGQYGNLSPAGMAYNGIYTYQKAISEICDHLVIDDGGGVTINHPNWSRMSLSDLFKLLDCDERVLGIEVASDIIADPDTGFNEDLWDAVLKTGRRCWGLAVPDHATERTSRCTGRNIMLVSNVSGNDCLRAYRNGEFYAKLYDSDLAFTNISYDDGVFSVSAPLADSIDIIIDGERTTTNANTTTANIPAGATYCRAEAHMAYTWRNEDGQDESVTEKLYTNPVMFKKYVKPVSDDWIVLADI